MPELPEVETIRRGLSRELVGDAITEVRILRDDSIAYPLPRKFAQKIRGHFFENFIRRGKYLIIQLDGKAQLVVHLKMSGRLLLLKESNSSDIESTHSGKKQRQPRGRRRSGSPVGATHGVARDENPYLRVCFSLKSKRELHFEDMRVFGRMWYVPPNMPYNKIIPGLATLGVEPSELTGKGLGKLFKNKTQAIKSALMDQRLIAGIGNIYADESLFQARINPLTKAREIKAEKLKKLAKAIKSVLDNAIELGGSSVRNYTDSSGVNGNYQNNAWVYGRAGKPCRVCGNTITKVKIAGRSSHFCSCCQS